MFKTLIKEIFSTIFNLFGLSKILFFIGRNSYNEVTKPNMFLTSVCKKNGKVMATRKLNEHYVTEIFGCGDKKCITHSNASKANDFHIKMENKFNMERLV